MKKLVFVLALFVMASGLSACSNTLNGAGQDMESAGKAIQDTF